MENIKIGHVSLTVDPDSISFVDIKNNIVLGGKRGGPANVIPIGSSDMAVKMGIVFKDEDDVNNKLRHIMSLKRGMPLLNIKSEFIAACYINSLAVKLKGPNPDAKEPTAQERKAKTDKERPKKLALLISSILVNSVLDKRIISQVGRENSLSRLYKSLLNNNRALSYMSQESISDPGVVSARRVLSDVPFFYSVIMKDSRYASMSEKDVVKEYLNIKSDDIQSGDSSVNRVTKETFTGIPANTIQVEDFDTINTISTNGRTFRIHGIDSYETTKPEKAGQEWYDSSAVSYSASSPQLEFDFWTISGPLKVLIYGKGYFGRSLGEFFAESATNGFQIGDSLNAGSVLRGYTFPMVVSSFADISPGDRAYLVNAKKSIDNNDDLWNGKYKNPILFNAGHTISKDRNDYSKAIDSTSEKTCLPSNFRKIERKSVRNIFKIKLSDVTATLVGSLDVVQFTTQLQVDGAAPVSVNIRAKVVKSGYNDFINNDYYFLTLGRDIRSASSYSKIVDDSAGLVTDSGNTNQYYINAYITSEQLKNAGPAPATAWLHFSLPFSEIIGTISSGSTVVSKIMVNKDGAGAFLQLQSTELHVDARAVVGSSIDYDELRARIDTGLSVSEISKNDWGDSNRGLELLERVFNDIVQEDESATALASRDDSSNSSNSLAGVSFPSGWIPLAFYSIDVSTIPNQPRSLYASLTFLPFDYSPMTPVFGYIPTEFDPSGSNLKAVDRAHNKVEFDLFKTPIVTEWLKKEYLVKKYGNKDFVGSFNPVTGEQSDASGLITPDVILKYDYPLPLFVDPKKVAKLGTTRADRTAVIRIYSKAKDKNDLSDTADTKNLYSMKLKSVNASEGTSIRKVSLQASPTPFIQNISRGAVSLRFVFETNSLESIAELRVMDAAFSLVSRSTYDNYVPVKTSIVSPVVSLFGNRSYVPSNFIISEVPGKPEWYTVTIDFAETSNSFKSESLTLSKRRDAGKLDQSQTDKLIKLTLDKLTYKGKDVNKKAVSDILWYNIMGENELLPQDAGRVQVASIPIPLFSVGTSGFDQSSYTSKKNKTRVGTMIRDLSKLTQKDGYSFYYEQYEHINFPTRESIKGVATNEFKNSLLQAFVALEFAPIFINKDPWYSNTQRAGTDKQFTFKNTNITGFNHQFSFEKNTIREYKGRVNSNILLYASSGFSFDGAQSGGVLEWAGVSDDWQRNNSTIDFSLLFKQRISLWSGRIVQALGKKYGVFGESFDPTKSAKFLSSSQNATPLPGIWGSFLADKIDSAINDRIKISSLFEYSFKTDTVLNVPGVNKRGNYPAYILHWISSHMYKAKNGTESSDYVKAFILYLLSTARKSKVFIEHLIHVADRISGLDEDFKFIESVIPRTQSGYGDMHLPRYVDIYGIEVKEGIKTDDMERAMISAVVSSSRINDSEYKSIHLSLVKLVDSPTLKLFLENMSDPEKIKEYKGSIVGIIDILLDKAALLSSGGIDQYEKYNSVKAFNALTIAKKILDKVANKPPSKVGVNQFNFPTFKDLSIPASISNVRGDRNVYKPARTLYETVEPGWQYFSTTLIKPEDLISQSAKIYTNISGKANSTKDLKVNDTDAQLLPGATSINTGTGDKTTRISTGQFSIDNKANVDLKKKTDDTKNKVIKSKNASSTPRISGSESDTESASKFPDKSNFQKYRGNDLHPSHENYYADMHKVRENFSFTNLFEPRRFAPTMHLYFIKDAASVDNLFQDWSDSYRYDSITYASVFLEKNGVDTAVLKLSNRTGILSNSVDLSRLQLSEEDVIKNGSTTITRQMQRRVRYKNSNDEDVASGSTIVNQPDGELIAFNLEAGINIQIRMGYSSIDLENPIIFNGKVAEVRPGKRMEIVAQGHGRELARNVDTSWSGSYNNFPVIITDLLRGTENLGTWEPYIYQENYMKDYRAAFPGALIRDNRVMVGSLETDSNYDRVNDAANDNLWGIKDDGALDSNWTIWLSWFNGKKWYVNGSALESIQSMARYIPNYISQVVPYDSRSTLYFGPRDGTYIYTGFLKKEELNYAKALSFYNKIGAQNSGNDFYVSPSNNLYSLGRKDPKGVFSTATFFRPNRRHATGLSGLLDVPYVDVARSFFYLVNMIMSGDTNAGSIIDAKDPKAFGYIYMKGYVLDDSRPRKYQSIERRRRSSGPTSPVSEIFYDAIMDANRHFNPVYSRRSIIDTERRSKIEFKSEADRDQSEANRKEHEFNIGAHTDKGFVDASNILFGKTRNNSNAQSDFHIVGSVDYNLFKKAIAADLDGMPPEAIEFFENNKELIVNAFEVGQIIRRFISSTVGSNGFDEARLDDYMTKDKDRDKPVFYYAIKAPSTGGVEYIGYLTVNSIFNNDRRAGSLVTFNLSSSKGDFHSRFMNELPVIMSKLASSYKPSAKSQSYLDYAVNPKPYPLPPNRKPFRSRHNIFDTTIISNDIIASKANMANTVTLWYPDSGNADEVASRIATSDLRSNKMPYAPILKETLDMDVFDRNCLASSYSGHKTWQVGMGFLGEGLREMYQGSLTIIGNPNIKPRDIIILRDTVKEMYGEFEVKTVTHIYDESSGYVSVITPHLAVDVMEDTEWAAALDSSLIESALTLISATALSFVTITGGLAYFGVAAAATIFSGGALLPVVLIATGALAYAGSRYLGSARGAGPGSSFLGISIPTYSTVGYVNSFLDNGEFSARRNPCRITPLTYRGAPLVAGLDGWDKRDWTNAESSAINDYYIQLGRKAIWKSFGDWMSLTVSDPVGGRADLLKNSIINQNRG